MIGVNIVNTQTREPPGHPDTDAPVLSYRALAMLLYKERRDRDLELPEGHDLWGEPAWDMLLDLFIATEDGRVVNVTSACIGACVPSTTGLRWIGQLSKARLIWRGVDPFDARKGTLGLTKKAVASMRRYLDRVGEARGYR